MESAAFSGLEVLISWEQSAEGQRASWGSYGGKDNFSQEFWWGKSHLALTWVYRRQWLRRETGLLRNQKEVGSERGIQEH